MRGAIHCILLATSLLHLLGPRQVLLTQLEGSRLIERGIRTRFTAAVETLSPTVRKSLQVCPLLPIIASL